MLKQQMASQVTTRELNLDGQRIVMGLITEPSFISLKQVKYDSLGSILN